MRLPGRTLTPDGPAPRVAVVGAGFGGLAAARRLERAGCAVTLIDRHNYHSFQPLLYQVSTAGLNPADVAYPVRGMFQRKPRVQFNQGLVVEVDWDGHRVLLQGEDPVPFDYLVVSGGSATNYFGVPGAEEYAFPLYTLSDALRLRNHLLSLFEAADSIRGLVAEGVLNIVVVGGGPTGVEVSGAVAELVNMVLVKDFHDLDVRATRVILVEQADTLLNGFSDKTRDYTVRSLGKRGVEVRLGTSVDRVDVDHVVLGGGEVVPTRMVVWAAGVKAAGLAGQIGAPQGRAGRIAVRSDLSIPGHPEAFAVGDIADIDDGDGGALPQVAQVALQGGKFAAEQILRTERGLAREEFSYKDKGMMATIGRHAAVAELPQGPRLTGYPAWLAWLLLHLVYLIGARNKVSVLVNWSWNYLTWDNGPRLILAPEELPQSPRTPPDSGTRPAGRARGRAGQAGVDGDDDGG